MNFSKTKGKRKWKKFTKLDIAVTIIMTALVILIIIPFWNAIVISLSTSRSYVREPFSLWPGEFTFGNYKLLFSRGDGLMRSYLNSIYVSIVGTLAGMVVMTAAAYAFSRRFPGRRIIFMFVIFSMYFGGGTVPTYLNLKSLGLLNKYEGIILLTLCATSHVIIMMKGFEAVPKELQEAAMLDGANDFKIFKSVMLPLNKPVLATFTLFTFVDLWNSWYWPTLILTDPKKSLLQVYLRGITANVDGMMRGASAADTAINQSFSAGVQMACILTVIVPVMFIYPFVQKHFVKGLYVGSVKM